MLIEMTPNSEHVTAVITSHMPDGENFDGAIVLGYYPEDNMEVFIKAQGITINVAVGDVDAFCKQLKRAKNLALEQKEAA